MIDIADQKPVDRLARLRRRLLRLIEDHEALDDLRGVAPQSEIDEMEAEIAEEIYALSKEWVRAAGELLTPK